MKQTSPKSLAVTKHPNATVYRNTEMSATGKPLPICFGSKVAKKSSAALKAQRKAARRAAKTR